MLAYKYLKTVYLLFLIITVPMIYTAEQLRGISIFSPRAQNDNAARDISGWHPYIHRYDATKNYKAFSLTSSYNQSLRPERMALTLFNSDTYTITGSQTKGREDTQELLADYFGLSPLFESNAFFKPYIYNLTLDGALYIGFDSWVKGLYTQFRTLGVWTQWNLNLSESIVNSPSESSFEKGYMAPTSVPVVYNSYTSAMQQSQPYGEVLPLKYGKISGAQSKSGFASLEWIFGYDFVNKETAHCGLNLRVTAPTGSRTKGKYFFEPRVGNGKLWEVGIGLTSHARVWEKDFDQELGFFVDLNVTHFCKGTERRSFDFLDNGFYSRYILLKEFDENGMFNNTVLPAINVTTLKCDVSVDLQFDGVLMFGYTHKNFICDIGYNAWIRTRERVHIKESIPANRYAFKGVQFVANPITGFPLNTTESTATIFETQPIIPDAMPIFISTSKLNARSAASPLLLTNKFFIHLAHTFTPQDHNRYAPFLGVGAEIEFEGINNHNAVQPDNTTMGQASIWLKGGIAY